MKELAERKSHLLVVPLMSPGSRIMNERSRLRDGRVADDCVLTSNERCCENMNM